MLVNMERLRWVPEEQPEDLLLVNIPEFRLHVYEGEEEVMAMDVIVGTHLSRTVIFSDSVSQVVFSPTWTVPASITRNEILPLLEDDPNYLTDRNMEIIGGTAELPVIRQRPGPGNALGRVKFLFPNDYGVYLHDTPDRELFEKPARAFSSGCMRIERALDLSRALLSRQNGWDAARIDAVLSGGKETRVALARPVPVVVAYFTAWVESDGGVQFRDDLYGRDPRPVTPEPEGCSVDETVQRP